jgi:hypothetical protein
MSDLETSAEVTPPEKAAASTDATTTTTEDSSWENSEGAGGKAAVLADLSQERKQRKEFQAQVAELTNFKAELTKLLGGGDKAADPAELARRISEAEAQRDQTQKLLSAYQAVPTGVDAQGLIDSVSFRAGLGDAEDVATYIKDFLKANPRFGAGASTAKNLTSGNGQAAKAESFDDVLRGIGR